MPLPMPQPGTCQPITQQSQARLHPRVFYAFYACADAQSQRGGRAASADPVERTDAWLLAGSIFDSQRQPLTPQ